MAKTAVYADIEVTVSLPDFDVPAHEIMLFYPENGIPTARIQVDLFHAASQTEAEPIAPTVEDYIEIWKSMDAMVASGTRVPAQFYIKLTDAEGTDTQELNSGTWVVSGAGIQNTRAKSAPTGVLELSHPVLAINDASPNLYGASNSLYPPSDLKTDNVYAALLSGLTQYEELIVAARPHAQSEFYPRMVEAYKAALEGFKTHVKWGSPHTDHGAWPTGLPADTLAKALWPTVTSSSTSTLWDWLTREVCSQWGLVLHPSLTAAPLKLAPLAPWLKPVADIPSSRVSNFAVPPVRANDIRGCLTRMTEDGSPTNAVIQYSSQERQLAFADAVGHVEEKLVGSIVPLRIPDWLRRVLQYSSPANQNTVIPIASSVEHFNAGTAPDTPVSGFKTVRDFYALVAKNQFVNDYRRGGRITVNMPFTLRIDGKDLVGGTPLSIDGKLQFYCTGAQHVISRADRSATTILEGAYVRAADTLDLEAIPGSTKSPLYL